MTFSWIPDADDGPGAHSRPILRGRPLRYLLVVILADARRPLTIVELVSRCRADGAHLGERPSKVVSDALRWEVRERRGGVRRVVRLRRGVYAIGEVPDSTMRWIRYRVAEARAWLRWVEAGAEFGEDGLPLGWEHWPRSSWVSNWPGWPARCADPRADEGAAA